MESFAEICIPNIPHSEIILHSAFCPLHLNGSQLSTTHPQLVPALPDDVGESAGMGVAGAEHLGKAVVVWIFGFQHVRDEVDGVGA